MDVKGGTITAVQWRCFAEFYVPLIFPEIAIQSWFNPTEESTQNRQIRARISTQITQAELDVTLLVSGVNLLLLRPEISEIQLCRAEVLLGRLVPSALGIWPGLEATRNIHQCIHIPGDVRRHGGPYNHWCFAGERCGKCYKNVNTNGKVVEITALNARLRASTASMIQHHLRRYALEPEDHQSVSKLASLHASFTREDKSRGSSASELFAEHEENIRQLQADAPVMEADKSTFQVVGSVLQHLDFNLWPIIHERLKNSPQTQPGDTYLLDMVGNRPTENTWIIDTSGINHTQIRPAYKQFSAYTGKKSPATAPLQAFRDRLAIILPQKDVFECRIGRPPLILIQSFITIRARASGGQTREFRLMLGAHGMPFERETEYPYGRQ
jgi:hypothetical protein